MPPLPPNQFALFLTRRFTPLFITQFLGAFVDNLYKNALVVLILYDMAGTIESDPKLLTTLAASVFILPYLIFSAIAGKLADRLPKNIIMQRVKLYEIAIACLGTVSLFCQSIPLCFVTLFALGTHSAFFAPCKYGILPQHLDRADLIGGNALINTGTFLAILIGTIAGTLLMTGDNGAAWVSLCFFISAVMGYATSRVIPHAPPPRDYDGIPLNPFYENRELLRFAFSHSPVIKMCLLAKGWFFFIGSLFMAQFANFTHDTIKGAEDILTLFLVLFSLGIGVGGLMNNRLLRGQISLRFVPWAGLGISLFTFDLFAASIGFPAPQDGIFLSLNDFIATTNGWRMIMDVTLISICGGLFVIPLSTMIQDKAPINDRARIIAASSVTDSLFMVVSALFSAVLIAAGADTPTLFLTFAVLNLAMLGYGWRDLRL